MSNVFNSKRTLAMGVVVLMLSLLQIEAFAGEEWELITQLPTEREDFATAVVENKVYLIGGSLYEDVKLDPRHPGPFGLSIVEEYDPQTNRWRRRADMPTPCTNARAAVANGIIYVFGGYSAKDNKIWNMKFTRSIEAYNPKNDRWIKKKDMPVSRISFDLGVVAGRVYLIGGSTGVGSVWNMKSQWPGWMSIIQRRICGGKHRTCRLAATQETWLSSATVFMPSAEGPPQPRVGCP